jgi:hypothetical protein
MSPRYEHCSTVLTSNKSFEEWSEISGVEVMAAALIDRVLHHCHIVNIRGNSYRIRGVLPVVEIAAPLLPPAGRRRQLRGAAGEQRRC